MSNVIFFHVATIGNWSDIYNELFDKITKSGLYKNVEKIYIGLVGNLNQDVSFWNKKIECIYWADDSNYEFLTLDKLIQFCKNNVNDKVLYIHTKGVSAPPEHKEAIDDWRKYMSYFLIENYELCLNKLEEYDICGVDWVEQPAKHFSGNFWWANASYINSLPKDWADKNNIIDRRHNCEFMIGMNNDVKSCSLHNSNINVYERHLHKYKKEQYEIGRNSN